MRRRDSLKIPDLLAQDSEELRDPVKYPSIPPTPAAWPRSGALSLGPPALSPSSGAKRRGLGWTVTFPAGQTQAKAAPRLSPPPQPPWWGLVIRLRVVCLAAGFLFLPWFFLGDWETFHAEVMPGLA